MTTWVADAEGQRLPSLVVPAMPIDGFVWVRIDLKFAGLVDSTEYGPFPATAGLPTVVDVAFPEEPTLHELQRAFVTHVVVSAGFASEEEGQRTGLDGASSAFLAYPAAQATEAPDLLDPAQVDASYPSGVTDPEAARAFMPDIVLEGGWIEPPLPTPWLAHGFEPDPDEVVEVTP